MKENINCRGFTLIEILVVIGIIAILAAIIFPVLSHAREQGRATVCVSNLRQIATAFAMYQQDNDGIAPINRACGMHHAPGGDPVAPCVDGDVTLGWMDFLQPYVKSYSVFKCPDDPTQIVPIPAGTPAFSPSAQLGQGYVFGGATLDYSTVGGANRCSYGKNNNLSNNGSYDAPEPPVKFPSTTILVFDFAPNQGGGDSGEQPASPYTIVRGTPGPGSSECTNWQLEGPSPTNADSDFYEQLTNDQARDEQQSLSSTRHSGGANYAFVDGHVKWLRPEQVYGECGFNSVLDTGNGGIHPDFRV